MIRSTARSCATWASTMRPSWSTRAGASTRRTLIACAQLCLPAYGDPRLVEMQTESTDPVARNVLNALTAAAPEWAKVDAAAPLGDYAGRITAAMDLLRQARESGETVAQKLAQGDLIARDHRGDLWAKFFADSAR